MKKTREMKDASNDAQRAKELKELQERLNEALRANEGLVYRNKKQEQSINAYKAANTKYRKIIDEQIASLNVCKNEIADAALREKKFVEQEQEALRELQIEFEKVKNQYYDAIEQYNNCKKRYDALLNMPWYKRIFIKE